MILFNTSEEIDEEIDIDPSAEEEEADDKQAHSLRQASECGAVTDLGEGGLATGKDITNNINYLSLFHWIESCY